MIAFSSGCTVSVPAIGNRRPCALTIRSSFATEMNTMTAVTNAASRYNVARSGSRVGSANGPPRSRIRTSVRALAQPYATGLGNGRADIVVGIQVTVLLVPQLTGGCRSDPRQLVMTAYVVELPLSQ